MQVQKNSWNLILLFFQDCMYDYCAMPGDTENICSAAAAYAKACAEAGHPVEGR